MKKTNVKQAIHKLVSCVLTTAMICSLIPSQVLAAKETATRAMTESAAIATTADEQYDLPLSEYKSGNILENGNYQKLYFFDMSDVYVGTPNSASLPDLSLHYAPFLYAGTIHAYNLDEQEKLTSEESDARRSDRSLFVSYGNLTLDDVNMYDLLQADLVYGQSYEGGNYSLRVLSGGTNYSAHADSYLQYEGNEWDQLLKKTDYGFYGSDSNVCYLPLWFRNFSYTQDVVEVETGDDPVTYAERSLVRGYQWLKTSVNIVGDDGQTVSVQSPMHADDMAYDEGGFTSSAYGWRPALEVTSAVDTMEAVDIHLNEGHMGRAKAIEQFHIVAVDGTYVAPPYLGLTRPDGTSAEADDGAFFVWNTKADGTGTDYQPGEELSMDDVPKLYAIWERGLPVDYDDGVADDSVSKLPQDTQCGMGTEFSISDTTPIREGNYEFDGWVVTRKDDNTEITVADDGSFTMPQTCGVTITAQWEEVAVETYTVTYTPGLAPESTAVPTDANAYEMGDIVTVSSDVPEWPGHTFLGWGYQEEPLRHGGDTFPMPNVGSEGFILAAIWEEISEQQVDYTIAFDYQGGTDKWNGTSRELKQENVTQTSFVFNFYTINNETLDSLDMLTRPGYELVGWAETATGPVVTDSFGTYIWGDDYGTPEFMQEPDGYREITLSKENPTKTFYAIWRAKDYKIAYFDISNATFEEANPTTYTGDTPTFTLHNPTKDGFTFKGWYGTELDALSTDVTIAQGSTGDREYTAVWEKSPYTLTINYVDAHNEDFTLESQAVPKEHKLSWSWDWPADPSAEDYVFLDWCTDKDGKGQLWTTDMVNLLLGGKMNYTTGDTLADAERTYYAIWKANEKWFLEVAPEYLTGYTALIYYTDAADSCGGYLYDGTRYSVVGVNDSGYIYRDDNGVEHAETAGFYKYAVVVPSVEGYTPDDYRDNFIRFTTTTHPEEVTYGLDVNDSHTIDLNDFSTWQGIYKVRPSYMTLTDSKRQLILLGADLDIGGSRIVGMADQAVAFGILEQQN